MAAAGEVHDPIAALRIANYRLFGAGFICSSTGLQMLSTAVAWEVWERTHDPLELGYIGLARALPVVLVALPAGHLADLHDRRRIVAITQAAFALTAALLAVASAMHAPMWCFYLLLVMSGTVRAFNGPSRAGLLPLLVPESVFGNAVTFNSGIFQTAAILGPLAAGYIIGLTGLTWLAYAACAVGCSVLSVTILFVKPHAAQRATGSMTFASMLAGMGHLWRERTILGAILLDLLAVLFGGATALLPHQLFHGGAVRHGILRAAFGGAQCSRGACPAQCSGKRLAGCKRSCERAIECISRSNSIDGVDFEGWRVTAVGAIHKICAAFAKLDYHVANAAVTELARGAFDGGRCI